MDELYRDVIGLQRKWRDCVDLPNHPTARQVDGAIQQLEDEIQVNKSAVTVEGRINWLINQLDRLEETPIISNSHINELQGGFERMRDKVRKLR